MDIETKIALTEHALERAYKTELIDGSYNDDLIAELSAELETLYKQVPAGEDAPCCGCCGTDSH